MNKIVKGILALSLGLGSFASTANAADPYPNHAVRYIEPWPPGGGADIIVRLMNNTLSQNLGQPVIIENRPGAGGNIGAALAAQAAPDGYTIVFAYSGTHSINPHVYAHMPFKESDFTPVIFLCSVPQLLVVNANVPVHNVKELIALAKKEPGKLKFGSSGNGAINHLGGVLFNSMAGVDMQHIPYKGGGPAALAVMSGEVDMVFGEPSTLLSAVKSGKLRAIALTSIKTSAALPGIPTINDTGVPGFDVTSWSGVLAPAGTPPAIIAKLNAAFNKTLADPAVKQHLFEQGYEPIGGKPEDFQKHIDRELAKWGPVVKKAGLRID